MDDPLITRTGTLMEAEIDEEIVGLSVERGACFGFNETASAIWRLTAEPVRRSQLLLALMDRYDVDRDTCAEELDGLLDELRQSGLITMESGQA